VVTEAWTMVEAKLLTPENFRDFTFVNPAMLHLSMNPDYFEGTIVAESARKLLAAGAAPRKTAAGAAS
jgi:hypothetical protein